jgi:hypothetical protein
MVRSANSGYATRGDHETLAKAIASAGRPPTEPPISEVGMNRIRRTAAMLAGLVGPVPAFSAAAPPASHPCRPLAAEMDAPVRVADALS